MSIVLRASQRWGVADEEVQTDEGRMRSLLKILGWVIACLFVMMIIGTLTISAVASSHSAYGWLALVVVFIPIFWPDRAIGLGARGVALAAFITVLSALVWTTGEVRDATEKRLVELEQENPAQYLVELKDYDHEKWRAELRRLDPEQYQIEMERVKQAKAKKRAEEAARVVAEKAERVEMRCRSKLAQIEAYNVATKFVADRLKAPSTADFPSAIGANVLPFAECSFEIGGYLDAQNGFGAMIRTHYTAKVTRAKDTEWRWYFDGVEFR